LFATKIDWVPLSGYQTNSCIDYFAIQNKSITSESRALLESSSIDKLKYINWMFRDFPEMKDWYPRIHSAVNGQYHRGTRQTEGIHLRNVQPACTRPEGCRRSRSVLSARRRA
jgi:hypothetical protein